MPYLESPGLSIMPLLSLNTPPGLYLQLITSGNWGPKICSKKGMCVMSSRLMMPPKLAQSAYSLAGVSFEENMIGPPTASARISSASDEQSKPNP